MSGSIQPHLMRYIVVSKRPIGFHLESVRWLPTDDEPPEWLRAGAILTKEQLVQVGLLGYGVKEEDDGETRKREPVKP